MEQFLGTKEDKINYLKGLIRMAKVDGEVLDSEKDYYYAVAKGLELNNEDIESIDGLWNCVETITISFTKKREALFFVQSAIQLSMVDENYDELEKKKYAR